MIILIDNYDSFTWNLYHFLGDIGAETVVHRNDKISVGQVISAKPEAIVISPGPATPNEAGICLDLIAAAAGKVPGASGERLRHSYSSHPSVHLPRRSRQSARSKCDATRSGATATERPPGPLSTSAATAANESQKPADTTAQGSIKQTTTPAQESTACGAKRRPLRLISPVTRTMAQVRCAGSPNPASKVYAIAPKLAKHNLGSAMVWRRKKVSLAAPLMRNSPRPKKAANPANIVTCEPDIDKRCPTPVRLKASHCSGSSASPLPITSASITAAAPGSSGARVTRAIASSKTSIRSCSASRLGAARCWAGWAPRRLGSRNGPSRWAPSNWARPLWCCCRASASTARAWRNGWFHTGDAFRRDADGNFFFVDRLKDAIRRRGENISSFEVEAEVNAHPAVREAAVVGVPSEFGEDDVMAVVAPVAGKSVDPAELLQFLVPRMAHFMIPRYVRVMPELPKTPTQKVQKNLLREAGVTADTWDREAAGIRIRRERLAGTN